MKDLMYTPGVWQLIWKDGPPTSIGGYSLPNALANAGLNGKRPENLHRCEKIPSSKAKGFLSGDLVVEAYPIGRTTRNEGFTLAELFQARVLDDPRFAWYVDYYTKVPWRFGVDYLAADPVIPWTNEKVSDRDPKDLENTSWGSEDVTSWFTDDRNRSYHHGLIFTASGATHSLTLWAGHARLDDEDDASQRKTWARYVENGVRGALEPFLPSFERLEGLRIEVLNEIAVQ